MAEIVVMFERKSCFQDISLKSQADISSFSNFGIVKLTKNNIYDSDSPVSVLSGDWSDVQWWGCCLLVYFKCILAIEGLNSKPASLRINVTPHDGYRLRMSAAALDYDQRSYGSGRCHVWHYEVVTDAYHTWSWCVTSRTSSWRQRCIKALEASLFYFLSTNFLNVVYHFINNRPSGDLSIL